MIVCSIWISTGRKNEDMQVKTIYTYRTVPSDAISVDWYVNARQVVDGQEIKIWKKNSNLFMQANIKFERDLLNECIAPGAVASFYVFYQSLLSSNGTGLYGLAMNPVKYNPKGSGKILSFENISLPGEKIAGSVEVTLCLAISEGTNSMNPYFATESGSKLFSTSILLHLEGNQALFPVKAIDFSQAPDLIAKDSLFFLKKYYTQLDSNFNSAYRLFFNTKHPLFSTINGENEDDKANQYIIKLIMVDVYKTIVSDALGDNGISEIQDVSDNSNMQNMFTLTAVYSHIVRDLLSFYFPGKDLQFLKNLVRGTNDDRIMLDTAIQSYVFGDTK